MRRIVGAIAAALLILPGMASGQSVTFEGDVGVVAYRVHADRVGVFEQAANRVLEAMREPAPADRAAPPLTLRLLRAVDANTGQATFVLIADPVIRGADYSLDGLAARVLPAGDAEDVRRQLQLALDGPPGVVDLTTLRSVSPLDALRDRLTLDLLRGASPGGEADDAERRRAMEALKSPLWSVVSFEHEVQGRNQGSSRYAWRAVVANPSLVAPVAVSVSVEFVDAAGRVVAASRPVSAFIEPQTQQTLSGSLDVAAPIASVIADAKLKIERRP